MDDDFYLPISHRANDPLETSGVDMATADTAVPDSNKGYQMLRAMGWREGVGLGRNEDGMLCVAYTKPYGETYLLAHRLFEGLERAQGPITEESTNLLALCTKEIIRFFLCPLLCDLAGIVGFSMRDRWLCTGTAACAWSKRKELEGACRAGLQSSAIHSALAH